MIYVAWNILRRSIQNSLSCFCWCFGFGSWTNWDTINCTAVIIHVLSLDINKPFLTWIASIVGLMVCIWYVVWNMCFLCCFLTRHPCLCPTIWTRGFDWQDSLPNRMNRTTIHVEAIQQVGCLKVLNKIHDG